MKDLQVLFEEYFPKAGGTMAGTLTLFGYGGNQGRAALASDWLEVAKRINEVDPDSPHHLSSADFRYYLPGLLIGCVCYLNNDSNPIAYAVLENLASSNDDKLWDDRFIERWCQYTPQQLHAIRLAVEKIYPIAEHYTVIARALIDRIWETLELIQIYVELERPHT